MGETVNPQVYPKNKSSEKVVYRLVHEWDDKVIVVCIPPNGEPYTKKMNVNELENGRYYR